MWDGLRRDLLFAARLLAHNPGTTVVGLLTLALGIGANTAIFSVVNALFLRPLPAVEAADRVVAGWGHDGGVSSYVNFLDLREDCRSFDSLAAYKPLRMDLAVGDTAEGVDGMIVTAEYFSTLGVEPALGRFFLPQEDRVPNAEAVVVLADHLWRSRFAADPDILGRTVALNGRAFVIVGIAPEGFRGTSLGSRPAVFTPMSMQPHFMPDSGNLLDRRGWSGTYFVGRLAEGVDLEQAQADVDRAAALIAEENPAFADFLDYTLAPLAGSTLAPGVRRDLMRYSWLLMAAVGIVLLVACVNVANLQLARSIRRRREIAVRQALGAGRLPLLRQLFVEAVMLALLGGAAGVLLALWAIRYLQSIPFPFRVDFTLDHRVLGFTAAVALAAGLVAGIAPALRATRTDLVSQLKDVGASIGHASHVRLGAGLVVGQVALSLVLLVMAALFARTLINLGRVDLGFGASGVTVSTVNPGLQGYEGAELRSYYRQLMTAVRSIPGVTAASLVSALPGPNNDDVETIDIEGFTPEPGQRPSINVSIVGDQYFETMHIPIVAGRPFGPRDDASATPVVIVNEEAARAFEEMTGRHVLGSRLSLMGTTAEVIGIAKNSRFASLRDRYRPLLYLAHAQASTAGFGSRMTLLIRSELGSHDVLAGLRHAAGQLDANVPLYSAGTLEAHLSSTLLQERLSATLLSAVAGLALLLASVGIYGVLSYSVSQRTAELGIRMALGAQRSRVLALVVRQGLAWTTIGIGVGLLATWSSSRLLGGFLFGIGSTDLGTYAMGTVTMVALALLASYLPALRATRIDAAVALRRE